MKRLYILLLLLVATISTSLAQEKADQITKLDGTSLAVKIKMVNDHDITFIYPGEEVLNTISTNLVQQVSFANGRVQTFAKRVEVKTEADWQKVLVTPLESSVQGLTVKGQVTGSARPFSGVSNPTAIDARATEKLQRKAAALGAHVVLLTETSNSTPGGAIVKKGVAYGY